MMGVVRATQTGVAYFRSERENLNLCVRGGEEKWVEISLTEKVLKDGGRKFPSIPQNRDFLANRKTQNSHVRTMDLLSPRSPLRPPADKPCNDDTDATGNTTRCGAPSTTYESHMEKSYGENLRQTLQTCLQLPARCKRRGLPLLSSSRCVSGLRVF